MRSTFCDAKLTDHGSSSFTPDDDTDGRCDNSIDESSAGSYSIIVTQQQQLHVHQHHDHLVCRQAPISSSSSEMTPYWTTHNYVTSQTANSETSDLADEIYLQKL